jgi:hypothetical protein
MRWISVLAVCWTAAVGTPAAVTVADNGAWDRSRQRISLARAEAQAAHNAMNRWLAGSPHLKSWRSYLESRELEAQLGRGEHADSVVVSRILSRYSGSAAGLKHRQFVAVRLALRNWLNALPPQADVSRKQVAHSSGNARPDERSVLPASAHRTPDGGVAAMSPAGAGSLVHPEVSSYSGPTPSETAACVMVRRRFLAAICRPQQMHCMSVRIPCDPLATPAGRAGPPQSYPQQLQPRYAVTEGVFWHDNYAAACHEARRREAMLFISFYDARWRGYEAVNHAELSRLAGSTRGYRYVWARLPLGHTTLDNGRRIRLVDHAAFAELRGRPGLAMIDYENRAAKHYGHMVSLFPLRSRAYGAGELAVILDLPPGTLTQRTIIYAVRTHPHFPRSAVGLPHHELLSEAQSHSRHQADIAVQGHHNWEDRFHRINAKLGQLTSREVVAESWPGESLLEAAIECVHSWRQSEGHWSAVSAPHAEYGYDMKLGSNGIWYATGLFGD